jgi:hypothetical protein
MHPQADLAMPFTTSDMYLFQSLYPSSASNVQAWLGGTQPNATSVIEPFGGWQWFDGRPVNMSYTSIPWNAGEPNGSGDCIQYIPGRYAIDDTACSNNRSFICAVHGMYPALYPI